MKKISGIIISLALLTGLLFVLTEYSSIPSPNDALYRVISATESLESVDFEMKNTIEMGNQNVSELKEEVKTYAQEIIGTDNFHIEAEIFAEGNLVRGFSLYTEKADDGMMVYIGENDDWFKIKSKVSLSELNLGIDSFATIIKLLKITEAHTIEKEEKDGKDVFVISGKIKDESTEDIVTSLRRADLEMLNEQTGLFDDINLDDIFRNLAPATVEIIADADSFRLIEFKLDATAAAQSAYNNFINEAGYGGMGFETTVREETAEIIINGHNNIDIIEIPEEVRAAQEYIGA